MSANLGYTNCYYCPGEVVLVEEPWLMTKENMRGGPQYVGLRFANAECGACLAQYLAWCDNPHGDARPVDGMGFYDLSFRSSFNDEPDDRDLPRYRVEQRLVRVGLFNEETNIYLSLGLLCPKCGAEPLREPGAFAEPPERGQLCWRCDVLPELKRKGREAELKR